MKLFGLLVLLTCSSSAATLLRVAAGGPGGSDSAGNLWAADQFSTGGATWVNCGSTTTPACPGGLTAPFLNLRYGLSFFYTLKLVPGLYNVTLELIEPNKTAAGQRLFNVLVNNQTALSSFDVFAQAGGALTPITRSFPVVATSGTIQLQFQAVMGNAVVSGIEIDDLPVIGPPGGQGPPGTPGTTGSAGPPGPLVPIQQDDFQVNCTTQPPLNCSGQYALTFMAIGRIIVLKNGTLIPRSCYTVQPPAPPNQAVIVLSCPVATGDVITLLYPAAGPASAVGNPAMLLRYQCPLNGPGFSCTGLEAHVLIDSMGTSTVWVAVPATPQIMTELGSWPISPTVFFQ